jgi:hypothetical protein
MGDRIGGTIMSSVAGGLASVAGGGKFENGAVTAAFGYLFNFVSHPTLRAAVPGQIAFDNGMTAFEEGRYGAALWHFGLMLGEQLLSVATLGTYQAEMTAVRAASTVELTMEQSANLVRFTTKLPSGAGPVAVDALGEDSVIFTARVRERFRDPRQSTRR